MDSGSVHARLNRSPQHPRYPSRVSRRQAVPRSTPTPLHQASAMSEFPALEDFDAAHGGGGDVKGDFLERERQMLGDEFGGAPTSFHADDFATPSGSFVDGDGDDDGFAAFASNGVHQNGTTPAQPTSSSTAGFHHVSVTAADDISNFENQFPDIEVPTSAHQPNGSFGAPSQSLYNQTTSFVSPYPETEVEEESEHIKAWREKQVEEIRQRDERSVARREEMVTAAEQAIDEFYNAYNAEKEKTIARNKSQEATFLQARDDALGQGTVWQRIADVIELQDSRSKTITKSHRDVSRFKELLLSLKRDGESAPGAAGY